MLSQISKKLAKLSKRFRRARVGHSRNPRSPQILQEAKGAMTRRILVHRESNMPSSSRTSPTTGRSRLNESCERVELDTAFYDEEGDTDSWDPSTRSERIDGLEAASDQPRTRRPLDLPTVCPTPMKCRRDIDYRLLSCPVHSNLFMTDRRFPPVPISESAMSRTQSKISVTEVVVVTPDLQICGKTKGSLPEATLASEMKVIAHHLREPHEEG